MAIRNVGVYISYEAGTTYWSLSAGDSTNNRLELVKGDTLQITLYDVDSRGVTLTASGFSSTYWTNTSNIVTTSSGSKVSQAGMSTPVDVNLTLSVSGGSTSGSRTLYLRFVSGDDITPDAFDLGDNVVGARLGNTYFSRTIQVSGINVGVTASITAGSLIVAGINRGSSYTVYANQSLQVALTASAAYSSTVGTTLNIGGVTDTWYITTMNDPETGQLIPFPITALPIKMSDVINFWGGLYQTYDQPSARNMLAYVRGGQYVPNISANANIPTAAPLKWTDFIGGATSFFLLFSPQYKEVSVSTLNTAVNAELTWTVGTDFDVGFGPGMRHNCEYRYADLVEYISPIHTQGVTLVSQSNPAVYNSTNKQLTIQASAPKFSERLYEGRLNVYIRLLWDTSKVITATIHYRIYCFGP